MSSHCSKIRSILTPGLFSIRFRRKDKTGSTSFRVLCRRCNICRGKAAGLGKEFHGLIRQPMKNIPNSMKSNLVISSAARALNSSTSRIKERRQEYMAILEVTNLKVYFPIKAGIFNRTVDYVRAVDGVSFVLEERSEERRVGKECRCGRVREH